MNFLFEVSKSVFYECFNSISICTKDLQWFYICEEFQGGENYVGHGGYPYVCRIVDTYCANDFE